MEQQYFERNEKPNTDIIINNFVLNFNDFEKHDIIDTPENNEEEEDMFLYYPSYYDSYKAKRNSKENEDDIINTMTDEPEDKSSGKSKSYDSDDSINENHNKKRQAESKIPSQYDTNSLEVNSPNSKLNKSSANDNKILRKVRQTEESGRQFIVGTFQAIMQPQPSPNLPSIP